MTATALRAEERAARYLVAPLLTDHLDSFANAPEGFKRLRELVLNMAVRGKLVTQDAKDEPASKVLDRIKSEKAKLNFRLRPSNEKSEPPYELPVGWAWTSLGEAGITNPRNEAGDDVETSFVPMAMIPAALGIPHLQEGRPWQEIKNGFTHFANNDVGVAKITPCFENGKSCVFRNLKHGIGAGTTELHVFRPLGDTILPDYVLIYLKNPAFLRNGERVMTGSAGQKRLPRSFFEGNPFPLPPLAEQSRIVAKVEELMALIDALEAKVGAGETARGKLLDTLLAALAGSPDAAATADAWAQLAPHFDLLLQTPADVDRLQQSLLQLAVKGRLVPQDPKDEHAAEFLKRIRAEKERLVAEGKIKREKPLPSIIDNELPFDVPGGWKWAKLGDVVISSEAGWSPSCESTPRESGKWGVLKVSAVSWGKFLDDENKALPSHLKARPECEVQPGDFLLSRANTAELVARSVVAWNPDPQLMLSDKIIRLHIAARADKAYINLFNNSSFARAHYVANASGTSASMKNVSREVVLSLPIPVPPAAEQSRIVAAVASLTALCDRLRERLAIRRALSAKLATALTESGLQ